MCARVYFVADFRWPMMRAITSELTEPSNTCDWRRTCYPVNTLLCTRCSYCVRPWFHLLYDDDDDQNGRASLFCKHKCLLFPIITHVVCRNRWIIDKLWTKQRILDAGGQKNGREPPENMCVCVWKSQLYASIIILCVHHRENRIFAPVFILTRHIIDVTCNV